MTTGPNDQPIILRLYRDIPRYTSLTFLTGKLRTDDCKQDLYISVVRSFRH